MSTQVNVAGAERWASALGGAALAAWGIKQLKEDRLPAAAVITATGVSLIARGATGHCPMYSAAGINTAETDSRVALGGSRGIQVEQVATINRAPEELFSYWRRFDQLPRFMGHLVSVRETDERRSHWIAKGPAGRKVEWDAEIVNEIPNELIGWRSIGDPDVVSAGSVRFRPAPGGRGTEVRIRLQYQPPAGKLGSTLAWLFGREPSQTIQEDLRKFKQLMEAGEAPTIEGQPRGRQSVLNYD